METKKEKTNEIYKLKLHESICIDNACNAKLEIIRVPGGWIYTVYYPGIQNVNSEFIPFDNEFQRERMP